MGASVMIFGETGRGVGGGVAGTVITIFPDGAGASMGFLHSYEVI